MCYIFYKWYNWVISFPSSSIHKINPKCKIENSIYIKIVKKDYLDNYLTFDKDFLECVQTLKCRFKLAILSNDVSEWSEYLTKNNVIKDYF
jgi:FMN phosphatase YigB (HAD superfamily)